MPWVGLQCVIVVFPDHTHLLIFNGTESIVVYFMFCRYSLFWQDSFLPGIFYVPFVRRLSNEDYSTIVHRGLLTV